MYTLTSSNVVHKADNLALCCLPSSNGLGALSGSQKLSLQGLVFYKSSCLAHDIKRKKTRPIKQGEKCDAKSSALCQEGKTPRICYSLSCLSIMRFVKWLTWCQSSCKMHGGTGTFVHYRTRPLKSNKKISKNTIYNSN